MESYLMSTLVSGPHFQFFLLDKSYIKILSLHHPAKESI